MNKIELKRKLLAMGLEVTADNQVKKKAIKKALRAIAITVTNKESLYEVLKYVDDMEEIVKEIKFQANNAKRDPDKSGQELLDAVQANLFRIERTTEKLSKTLSLSF